MRGAKEIEKFLRSQKPNYHIDILMKKLSWISSTHLRACALKPFSLHFFHPSFGLTNLHGRLLRLSVALSQFSHLAIWPEGSTVEGICVHTSYETAEGHATAARDVSTLLEVEEGEMVS